MPGHKLASSVLGPETLQFLLLLYDNYIREGILPGQRILAVKKLVACPAAHAETCGEYFDFAKGSPQEFSMRFIKKNKRIVEAMRGIESNPDLFAAKDALREAIKTGEYFGKIKPRFHPKVGPLLMYIYLVDNIISAQTY